jgi:ribosomal protein S8E
MLFSQRISLEMFVGIGLKREHDNEIAAASARTQNLTKILEGFTRQCARRVESNLSQAAEQVNVANVSGALAQASQRQRLIALLPIDGLNRAFVGIVTKGAIIVSTAAETSHAGISGAFNARWRYTTGGTVPTCKLSGNTRKEAATQVKANRLSA